MLILIGASASGKTETARILTEQYHMKRMVTYTTRKIRPGETDGVSYHFVTKRKFKQMEANQEFAETTCYGNNLYGTGKKDIDVNKVVILSPNGFAAFRKLMPDKIVSFYLRTDEAKRIERMRLRKDKEEVIKKRIEYDRRVFGDIPGIDFQIFNEDIDPKEAADRIYRLYKEKTK